MQELCQFPGHLFIVFSPGIQEDPRRTILQQALRLLLASGSKRIYILLIPEQVKRHDHYNIRRVQPIVIRHAWLQKPGIHQGPVISAALRQIRPSLLLHLRVIDGLLLIHGEYVHPDGAQKRRYPEFLLRLILLKQRDVPLEYNAQDVLMDLGILQHLVEQEAAGKVQFLQWY